MSRVYKIVAATDIQVDSGDHFFCSLCGFTLLTEDDFQQHADHKSCSSCYLKFVEARKNEWSSGWRPKKNAIRKHINERKRLIISVAKR